MYNDFLANFKLKYLENLLIRTQISNTNFHPVLIHQKSYLQCGESSRHFLTVIEIVQAFI